MRVRGTALRLRPGKRKSCSKKAQREGDDGVFRCREASKAASRSSAAAAVETGLCGCSWLLAVDWREEGFLRAHRLPDARRGTNDDAFDEGVVEAKKEEGAIA